MKSLFESSIPFAWKNWHTSIINAQFSSDHSIWVAFNLLFWQIIGKTLGRIKTFFVEKI